MPGLGRASPSTILVLFAVAHCLVFLNTVGSPGFSVPGPGVNEFGWPFTYMFGSLTHTQQVQYERFRDTRDVRASPCEVLSDGVALRQLDKSALAGNILIALAIFASVGALLEYRRRLMRQSGNFRLRSLFWLTAFVCIFGSATRSTAVMSFYLEDVCRWRRMTVLVALGFVSWIVISPWLRVYERRTKTHPQEGKGVR
jgi:hypothetical protein